jgi:hypothetical protein
MLSANCNPAQRHQVEANLHEAAAWKRHGEDLSIMNPKYLLFASLAWLSLVVCADVAIAQLPNCNCYFMRDCPAEKPICQLHLTGGGPQGPDDPDRACEWMEPKPTGAPAPDAISRMTAPAAHATVSV